MAPSQDILNAHEADPGRVLEPMRWGLVPRWAKDSRKLHPINARAETVATNGVFRLAFRSGRTLIPADGFYEWRRTEQGKQPFFVYRNDGEPMWFAGVSDTWQGEDGPLTRCAIITTGANEVVRQLHERMPVILPADALGHLQQPRHPRRQIVEIRPGHPEPAVITGRDIGVIKQAEPILLLLGVLRKNVHDPLGDRAPGA